MNLLPLLCPYMALVRVPFDLLFTPIARDEEVGPGVVFVIPTVALWRSR
jgi:hypothetical protein